MRKSFIAALALLLSISGLSAQNLLKYNYKKNGYVYTGTERIRVESKTNPVQVKLSRVLFSDGQPIYILRLEFEDATAWKMPKNAPLTIVNADGRSIVLKNASDEANLVAPDGIKTDAGTVFLNYGEYYVDESEMTKILAGVKSIDATKRWSSQGSIKIDYASNELGSAIKRQYDAIASASKPTEELGSNLTSVQDQRGSRLVESKVEEVGDGLAVSLVYLYYGPSNSESIDLNLYLTGNNVPFNAPVTIATKSGKLITLRQEKELMGGRVICYPTIDEIRDMADGVSSITLKTAGGNVSPTIDGDKFGKVIDRLYNSLQTAAIL